jgi:hypothetical protein
MFHRLPQQSLVDLVGRKQRVSQLHRAHLFSVQIQYIHVCHRLLLLPDAFSGSQSQFVRLESIQFFSFTRSQLLRPKARLPKLFALAAGLL